MSSRNQTSITVKDDTKRVIDSVIIKINSRRLEEKRSKITQDVFFKKLFSDHQLVGGSLICHATF